MKGRRHIRVTGVVQGVGFRPFVYNLATQIGLVGTVQNDAAGVLIEVEGEAGQLALFEQALKENAPPLAVVERVVVEPMPSPIPLDEWPASFEIIASQDCAEHTALIAPDVATCADCLRELHNPSNRRYRYPFINCTNCGPRFTIIQGVPYDRPLTTMAGFTMCEACQQEYDHPHDRRFHAQPNACVVCGPTVALQRAPCSEAVTGEDAIRQGQQVLKTGGVLAVKGLGGYHLACDAQSEGAVRLLRQRKGRWEKPFALMARDLATVESVCEVSAAERAVLLSAQRPIVLLSARKDADLSPAIAPHQRQLGIMLPYTPLHHLLLTEACPLLVMTSGNASDEPIAYEDEDARARLGNIADAMLTSNRPIHMRCDDSVVRVVSRANPQTQFLRRARGYAPQPLRLDTPFVEPILAMGGYLKNTFCLGKGQHAFLSHHIGDLDEVATRLSYRESIRHYQSLFDIEPTVIAHDFHPDYYSTQLAEEMPACRYIPVQHHHAHIASVMAEHDLHEPVIGVAFDGSGYGADGTVWGGEFMIADRARTTRMMHLAHLPLLGGEQAVRQPWRVAAAWLQQHVGDGWLDLPLPFCQVINQQQWTVLRQMEKRQINSPLTSSMGRLFDAVAALIGVRQTVSYEGQAAIELEQLVDEAVTDRYAFACHASVIGTKPLLSALLADLQAGVGQSEMAGKFHNGVIEMIVEQCRSLRQQTHLNTVALSGGVFQNHLLTQRALQQLAEQGFSAYINTCVPPNDGGLALGQAIVANAQLVEKG
ncbi:carbamoyltransferase HypF [Candidatus Entotheonella palauensis]|uniref:carbamoyltransferase HypF n=1 Tax=Candidatus Entotheonella palauensis TaxID=93172 RepID=UPI000B7CA60B|nr:carbamoyltransferase HypF [Candidatus Entotheonella palauensis]